MTKRDQDVDDLKKEVATLKRQLARANREIARLQGTVEEKEEDESEKTSRAPTCPNCRSTDIGELSTPNGKHFFACRACKKWRSRAR